MHFIKDYGYAELAAPAHITTNHSKLRKSKKYLKR